MRRLPTHAPLRALLFPFLLLLLLPPLPVTAKPNGGAFSGTGSCAASNCHGGTSGRQASGVLQNEFTTWSKHDAHSRAWQVLTEPRSEQMAKHLGLASPREAAECTTCHAPWNGEGKRWDEDGVGCEGCHGGAEKWLKSHVERGATHEDNVARGLSDLVNLSQRASVCASCHIGDASRWVTHRMYGAGHPRLSFELDTFTALMPAHWVVDDDYVKRKSTYDSVRAFLVGQSVSASRSLEAVRRSLQENRRLLPDFTIFSCFSCHRGIRSAEWEVSEYGGSPGEPRLQTAPLLILEAALETGKAALAEPLRSSREGMERSFHETNSVDGIDGLLELLTGKVLTATQSWQGDDSAKRALAQRILALADGRTVVSFELAEQITMGSGAILSGLPSRTAEMENALKALYTALADPERYHSKTFRDAAKKLAARLKA